MKIKLKTLIGGMGCLVLALSLVGCASSPHFAYASVPSNNKINAVVIHQDMRYMDIPMLRTSLLGTSSKPAYSMRSILKDELIKRGIQVEVRDVPTRSSLPGKYMISWYGKYDFEGDLVEASINIDKNGSNIAFSKLTNYQGLLKSVSYSNRLEKAVSILVDQLLTGNSELANIAIPHTDLGTISDDLKINIVSSEQWHQRTSTPQTDNSAAYAAIITNAVNASVAASRPRQPTIIVQPPAPSNTKNQVTYEQIRRQNDLRQLGKEVNKLRGIPY